MLRTKNVDLCLSVDGFMTNLTINRDINLSNLTHDNAWLRVAGVTSTHQSQIADVENTHRRECDDVA